MFNALKMVGQTVTLNSGHAMPILGLGTWKSKPGEVTKVVEYAIDIGYRHFDCAYAYQNEKEVGVAIANKLSEGIVKRKDLFITSKLWHAFHKPELVEGAFKTSLNNLGLDYLDLYLIHNPLGLKEGPELFNYDANGKLQFSGVDYVDTWKEMEKLAQSGSAKSIGISNFNKRQIERILEIATIPPAMNQVECHPYLNQKRLIAFCKTKGIGVTAYSPLGSPDRPWAKPDEPSLLEDPKLNDLAVKYNKTVAQLLLKYQVQRGVVTIPKSATKSRIQENLNIFDFELSSADMDYIDTFDCNGRFCPMPYGFGHPDHPFENDEF